MKTHALIRNAYLCLSVIAILLAGGCSKKDQAEKAVSQKDQARVVARVGYGTISANDLKAYLNARPLGRSTNASEKALSERLDEMIMAEVMYQEAMRLKLDQDPEMRRNIRQMLSQRLLQAQVIRPVMERKIEEQELQKYYDEHINEYSHPEQVRLADIFVAVPEGATPKEKEEKKQKAEEALAEVREKMKDSSRFGFMIRRYSDKHPAYSLGDTGFFDKEGKPLGLDKALVESAFALAKNGDIADRVIETPDGFHVIMRTGTQPALNRELKDVSPRIEQIIRREEMAKKREEYLRSLKDKAGVEIEDQVVKDVLAETLNQEQESQKPGINRPAGGGRTMTPFPPVK